MKAKKFLSNRELIEGWLLKEKESLESNDSYDVHMQYWFHSKNTNGFGVTLLVINAGEFHVMGDGKVSMYVEEGPGEIIFSSESTATTEQTLYQLFDNFKKKVFDEKT